jgi:Mn-containing catalase
VQELPAPDPLQFATYDGSKGPGKPGNAGGAYVQGAQNLVSKAKEKLTPGE